MCGIAGHVAPGRPQAAERTVATMVDALARRVMILNPGMAQEAAAAGLDPDRLLWMPNPVDTDEFAPCSPERRRELRARFGIEPSAPAIIFTGRLAPEKELPSLIRAFAAVRRDVPDATLILVGDGPMRSQLEMLAAGLNLAGPVRFTGRQTGAEVRQWLQASDIFALVSSNEGLPCSLLEAMSVGLSSVISDIPANVQLVENQVHGLHAALGSPDQIAARQSVLSGYSIDKVVDRYETLFSETLDTGQRSPEERRRR